MNRVRSTVWIGAVALAAAALVSCGLFDTRDPAGPTPSPENCLALTGSAAVTQNVVSAYGRLELITCYTSLFDTTFAFHPDAQDSFQNPDGFAGWDERVEAGHNSEIATLQTFINVNFPSQYQPAIISPDQKTEVRFYDYVIRAQGLAPGDTTVARFTGQADMTFRRGDDGQWRLIDWADHRFGSDSTWGLLRSNFRP